MCVATVSTPAKYVVEQRAEDGDEDGNEGEREGAGAEQARQSTPSLVRFLPVSQYLLGLTPGVWVLECWRVNLPRGVKTHTESAFNTARCGSILPRAQVQANRQRRRSLTVGSSDVAMLARRSAPGSLLASRS